MMDASLEPLPKRSFLRHDRQVLDDLPRFVMLGAPGAGTSALMRRSGLPFLMDEEGPWTELSTALHEVHWGVTRELVLVDVPGRYVMPEGHREIAAQAGWEALLALLARQDARRGLDGVILCCSLASLLLDSPSRRVEAARRLGSRLQELQERFGAGLPVFVVATQADLVPGFRETFEPLEKAQREQPWGFDLHGARGERVPARLRERCADLVDHLAEGLLERLQAEREPERRACIHAFPHELAAVVPRLEAFLQEVFGHRWDAGEGMHLQGLYFTSVIQQGTPVGDALIPPDPELALPALPPAARKTGERSYFVHDFFASLAAALPRRADSEPNARHRGSLRRLALSALVAAVAFAGAGLAALDYVDEQAYLKDVGERLPALQKLVEELPRQPGTLASVLPVLDAAHDAARSERLAGRISFMPEVLRPYRDGPLQEAAGRGYRNLLMHALAPHVESRLEERLRMAPSQDFDQSYESLKAYLMLHLRERYDARVLQGLLAADWDRQLEDWPRERRRQLEMHLHALLQSGPWQAAHPLDEALVGKVRQALAAFPPEYRIYGRLRQRFALAMPEFAVTDATGPNAVGVLARQSGQPLAHGVPGFYTRDGYGQAFQDDLPELARKLASEEDWVIGPQAAPDQSLAAPDFTERLRLLYLKDYANTWEHLLDDVQLAGVNDVAQAAEQARMLAASGSPLAAWLRAAAQETTLVPTPAASGQPAAEAVVDERFTGLHRLLQGEPPPLDAVLQAFGEAARQLDSVVAARDSHVAAPAEAIARIRALAAAAPLPPLQGMFSALADAAQGQADRAEREFAASELVSLAAVCTGAVAGRYPFDGASRMDVLIDDFVQLFSPGGQFDDFFERHLAHAVDTSAAAWRLKPGEQKLPGASSLQEFQRAARIREAFFAQGGQVPSSRWDVKVLAMGPGEGTLELASDSERHVLSPGAVFTLAWPGDQPAARWSFTAVPGGQAVVFDGPWALYRLLDSAEAEGARTTHGKFRATLKLGELHAELELTPAGGADPLHMPELQRFNCPSAP